MAFVLDASIAAAWFLPDENSIVGDRLLLGLESEAAIVPTLFWFEIRNVLMMAEKRGRLQEGEASRCMRQLRSLPIEDLGSGSDEQILELARRHGLSAYDASYLALALDQNLPLGTSDRQLVAAALRESVEIIDS